jgi:hypothetical protein
MFELAFQIYKRGLGKIPPITLSSRMAVPGSTSVPFSPFRSIQNKNNSGGSTRKKGKLIFKSEAWSG